MDQSTLSDQCLARRNAASSSTSTINVATRASWGFESVSVKLFATAFPIVVEGWARAPQHVSPIRFE